jgi:hypothetical protein
MQKNLYYTKFYFFNFLLLLAAAVISVPVYGQEHLHTDSVKKDSAKVEKKIIERSRSYDVNKQYDFSDLTRNILHPHRKADTTHTRSSVIVVPNISANPTIGFQGGIKAVVGKKLGDDPNTLLSTGATSASITTKGIIYFYVNHNIFTPGNKWNFQGNFVISKSAVPDEGFGIGDGRDIGSKEEQILADPTHKIYAIHSIYFNFREKAYKEVAKDLFLGAGLSFDVREHIQNKDSTGTSTPSGVYNTEHGLPQTHSASDGFLFNVEYTTRDNPNRAYKGVYFDFGIRENQTWIGSTKNATQITTDIRKYISLSSTNPETVLALWNWGSYLANGTLPYLDLPGTARDGTFRSGRGYTATYFKGTEFNDTEAEFRFPIMANKFVSGVVFGNMQTSDDEQGTKIFQVFQPGYGAGLRILFNKVTRTNLALDYAFGRFGNHGFFLNLNEAF